ncbi:MAG: hypothetical protein OHK0056_26520 [Bacteriovoracaceae bacterium]
MKRSLAGLALIVAVASCSLTETNKWRIPASYTDSGDIYALIDQLGDDIEKPVASAKECRDGLSEYYQQFFTLTTDKINTSLLKGEYLDRVLKRSFETRLAIKEKLKQLTEAKTVDEVGCLSAVRDMIRVLRYIEDYMVEFKEIKEEGKAAEEFKSLEGDEPYLIVNPAYKSNFKDWRDLKSGDIILSRGNAYSSAAIARIGSVDAQFSHLSLVYKDEKGKLFTIEAHIEIGNITAPIEEHLHGLNAREVVFRFKNEKVAAKAAKYMYEKVKAKQDAGKNIRYDFGMDYKDNKKLFCSEVIYDGYQFASDNTLNMPLFKTKFNKGLIPFLNKLGIKVNERNVDSFDTFAPGDIEFDPRVDLVAEFRNPSKLQDVRMKDAILTKFFQWMENENYQFDPTTRMGLKAHAAWWMRRTPFIKKKLQEKFPLNMKTEQLKMFMVLDVVAEMFHEHLTELHKKRDLPMTPVEMYRAIEEFKVIDAAKYNDRKHRKEAKFHKYFRPMEKVVEAERNVPFRGD